MVSEQTKEGLAALIEKGKAVLRTRKPNPANVISPYIYMWMVAFFRSGEARRWHG